MSHSDQLKRLVVEHELALDGFDDGAVEDWASFELGTDDPHPLAYELFNRHCDVDATLKHIAKNRHGFSPFSPAGDQIVGQIALETLSRFDRRELSPMELCQFAARIAGYYADTVPSQHPTPVWVSGLRNGCDYCDASWTHGTRETW